MALVAVSTSDVQSNFLSSGMSGMLLLFLLAPSEFGAVGKIFLCGLLLLVLDKEVSEEEDEVLTTVAGLAVW